METLLGYLYPPFLALQQVPDKTIQVTVQNSGRVWYQNPIWIAIGILAVVMVLLLIVIAVRGSSSGGTTIVKD